MRPENVEGTELSSFAADLRALRKTAGYPTFGELAASGDATVHELSDAARGLKLPTWPVVASFVRACGGEPDEWRTRHGDLVAAQRRRPSTAPPQTRTKKATTAVPVSVFASMLLVAVAVFGVVARGNTTFRTVGGGTGAAIQTTTADAGADVPTPPDMTLPTAPDAFPPLVLSQYAALASGTLIQRKDSPEVSVVVGDARVAYTDWDELAAGYGPEPHITVLSDDVYDSLPTTPEDGSLVKEVGDREIAAVDGTDRIVYPTWDALVADRGANPNFVTVPKAYFDSLEARQFTER